MSESRIVWLRDPSAFPWVRVMTDFVPTRVGGAKRGSKGDHVIGYAELSPSAESHNRRFRRRFFYLRDTDYPFGTDYPPEAAHRPTEAVDPLTVVANTQGELTPRSRSAADLTLIHEERRSDVAYEALDGRPYLVLERPNEQAKTEACPFCGRPHSHGTGDGHRVGHCVGERMKDEVVALDGTRLRRDDGYVVRTRAVPQPPAATASDEGPHPSSGKRGKPPLSWQEHEALGAELNDVRERLMRIAMTMSNRVGKASKASRTAHAAQRSVDELRCELDPLVFKAFPGKDPKNLMQIYYPQAEDRSEEA